MSSTAKLGKHGQMTLPGDVRTRYGLQEGQSVAFVFKDDELTLVLRRKTLFDFKGAVQPKEESNIEAIRDQVASDQAACLARDEWRVR